MAPLARGGSRVVEREQERWRLKSDRLGWHDAGGARHTPDNLALQTGGYECSASAFGRVLLGFVARGPGPHPADCGLGALSGAAAQALPVSGRRCPSRPIPRRSPAMLRYGDVLLTEGNTRMAALVRRITGSPWSHVSMYVGPLEEGSDPRCIVEADVAAGARAVPLSELKGLRVRVLRPPACPIPIDGASRIGS